MLVGLVFMITGVVLWVVAGQAEKTAAAPEIQTAGLGIASWASRVSGGVSFVTGFLLFALRTRSVIVLLGLSLAGLVVSVLAARRA